MSYEACIKIEDPIKECLSYDVRPDGIDNAYSLLFQFKKNYEHENWCNVPLDDLLYTCKKILMIDLYIQQETYKDDWTKYFIVCNDEISSKEDLRERICEAIKCFYKEQRALNTYSQIISVPSNDKDKFWKNDHYEPYSDSTPYFENLNYLCEVKERSIEIMKDAVADITRYNLALKYFDSIKQG